MIHDQGHTVAQAGDLVLLISEDNKRFYTRLSAGRRQHTHQGIIEHDQLIDQPLGRKITSTTGQIYIVIEPSLEDLMKEIRRKTQIVYPKEAGRIIFKLNIYPGRRVIEAGTGSGALTIALARFVSPGGRVYSYEIREEMQRNAQENLWKVGLDDAVDFKVRDIANGFDETEVDAVFLDVKEPWLYLPHVKAALKPSGFFGAIIPTTNQVTDLLIGLKQHDFGDPQVEENWTRAYKPVAGRLRPEDVMVGHTGFLVFARNVTTDTFPEHRPHQRVSL